MLTLINRLFARSPRPAFSFGFLLDDRLRDTDFARIRLNLASQLYSPGNPHGWLVIYHPGSLHDFGRLGCLAVATTPGQANERLAEELPRVLSAIL